MPLVHPLTLVSAAISAKDVRTAASVYQFIPAAKGNCQIICRLTVAGNGDYVVYLTHQWAGAGIVSIVGPKTTITLAAGETYLEFVSLWIGVEATDVFEVMVDGLSGDSAVTGNIRIYADNPSIFDPAADTVANVTNLATYTGNTKQTGDADAQMVYNNFVNALSVLNGADINYFLNRMS